MPGPSLHDRIKNRYKSLGVNIVSPQIDKLIHFSVKEKNMTEKSRVNSRGLVSVLQRFIESIHSPGRNLILSPHLRSALTNNSLLKYQKKSSLIPLLAAKRPAQVHVIAATPNTQKRIRSRLDDLDTPLSNVRFCLFSPSKDKSHSPSKKRTPLKERDGVEKLETRLRGPSFAHYSTVESPKELDSIPFFNLDSCLRENIKNSHTEPENFSFTINKETILSRANTPRPISQNQLMGISAKDALIAAGAMIDDHLSGRYFHHAHRQAFSLGGAQSRENLDPSTAGANYETLFMIETPLKEKVLKDNVIAHVTGNVYYNDVTKLTEKITYDFYWDNMKEPIRKSIYPLCPKGPTEDDHAIAAIVISCARP